MFDEDPIGLCDTRYHWLTAPRVQRPIPFSETIFIYNLFAVSLAFHSGSVINRINISPSAFGGTSAVPYEIFSSWYPRFSHMITCVSGFTMTSFCASLFMGNAGSAIMQTFLLDITISQQSVMA